MQILVVLAFTWFRLRRLDVCRVWVGWSVVVLDARGFARVELGGWSAGATAVGGSWSLEV